MKIKIIFENKNYFAFNKPSNLVTLPGIKNTKNTLLNILIENFKYLCKIENAGIIHRLDKDTTGVILVAKNKEYYFLLKKLFLLRKIIKKYYAIVTGVLISGGKIDANISKHKYKYNKNCVNNYGKKSITYYKIKKKLNLHTFIELKLITGRTHQIRVHLSYINYPILGDKKYKNNSSNFKKSYYFLKKYNININKQVLHSYNLKFIDPIKKNIVNIKTGIPTYINKIINLIEKYK